jgi:Fe-S-cluster containining protein
MSTEPDCGAGGTVTAHLALNVSGRRISADITVPDAPVRVTEMLPVFQSLADAVIGAAVQAVEDQGKSVSCCKGCGACCRQLVPIAEAEARRIRDLVEALPEPRRSGVRARFAEAKRRLQQAGLLERLEQRTHWAKDDRQPIGLAYFAEQIACPFLEEESCSIHPDRPIACREYLVTSPAANCARPTPEGVACVPLPTRIWPSVALFDEVPPGQTNIRWVPLALAPDWADAHPEEPPPQRAPELLGAMLERLTGKAIPTPPTSASATLP